MHETRELLAGGDVALGGWPLPPVCLGSSLALLPWCDSALRGGRGDGLEAPAGNRVHSAQERTVDAEELAPDVRGALQGDASSGDVGSALCDKGRSPGGHVLEA